MKVSSAARKNIGFWRDASGYPENGPELVYTVEAQARRAGNGRVFPRSLHLGSRWIRLQPHGSGGGGRRPASSYPSDRRPRAGRDEPRQSASSSMVRMPGNTIPGTEGSFCADFTSASRTTQQIRALTMSEAVEVGSGPAAPGGDFPRVMDQREFRRLDRTLGGCSRVGSAARCTRDAFERAKGVAILNNPVDPGELDAAGRARLRGGSGGRRQRLVLVVRSGARFGERRGFRPPVPQASHGHIQRAR